jgi:hypothetical protein
MDFPANAATLGTCVLRIDHRLGLQAVWTGHRVPLAGASLGAARVDT